MEISSTMFSVNGNLPQEYTCDGQGISPPLSIRGVPARAQSLALLVSDPDAPAGTFVHWVLWNIPPKITEIPGGAIPEGTMEGLSSIGKTGYVAACPPSGTHHYHFRVFALDTLLKFTDKPTAAMLTKAMDDHVIETAELVALYHRI